MFQMRYLPVMGKPRNEVYQKFTEKYKKINEQLGMKQYLVPYLMSSHPGSTLKEAVELAEYLQRSWVYAGTGTGFLSDTVNDFYLYVLYRCGSKDDETGVCSEESARKGDAACFDPVSQSAEL